MTRILPFLLLLLWLAAPDAAAQNAAAMRRDGANSVLPNARTNLGLDQEGGGTSVINLGADPTGAADVKAIIQASVTTGTHSFYFPAGTYKFDGVVQAPAGKTTTIRCEPGKTTLISGAARAAAAGMFFYAPSTATLDIEGCKFDGNMLNVGRDLCFIITVDSNNNRIHGNTFTNNRFSIGCHTRSDNSSWRYNLFDQVGQWWRNGGLSTTALIAVTFNDSPSKVDAGSGNVFSDNIAWLIESDLVDAGPVFGFQFNNNVVIGANNGFVGPLGEGQGALYAFFGSRGVTASGNYIYGLTGNGLDIHCADDITATGNISNHNGGSGIAISGAAAGDTLTCNNAGTAQAVSRYTVSGNITNDNWQGTAGMVTLVTNNTTAAGNPVLNFASTTGVVDGMYVEGTAGSGIAAGTTVVSHTATTVTMSAVATGGGVANPQTIIFLNNFPFRPGPDSGIWIGTVLGSGTANTISLSGNVATDTQATKTQRYGVNVETTALTNYVFADSNQLAGNLVGNVGGIAAPVLTSCGTGSPAIAGDDVSGKVTMGTNATGCVITFNAGYYPAAPYCTVTWVATPLASQSYVVAAGSITLTQTSASGNIVYYSCKKA